VSLDARSDKSPELNLFAQLCGAKSIDNSILGIYSGLRTCIDLGERGWGLALALLNIALGGSVAVPDAVTVVPPGYLKYVKRMALLDEVAVESLFPDIPFPYRHRFKTVTKDKEGTEVEIEDERFPRAFGVFVEYEYPDFADGSARTERLLVVVYDAGTGSYPYKAFIAPASKAEKVAEVLDKSGARHYEVPMANELLELLKQYSLSELEKLIGEGKVVLPPGVTIKQRARGRGALERN